MTAGQGVVWYTGQFYALTFLQTALKLDWKTAYVLVSIALALATPLFVMFGRLSDRVGRKRIMLGGCLLAALTYVPIYVAMKHFASPVNHVALVLLLTVQMVYVCMVYGPIAAFLVELFPTRDPVHVDVAAVSPGERVVGASCRSSPPPSRRRRGRRRRSATGPTTRASPTPSRCAS